MSQISRRKFFVGAGVVAAYTALPAFGLPASSPFKIGVISDEISPDFDHACSVISKEFGLQWVELRSMWGKNLQELSDDQLAEAEKILAKYKLGVTDIASPLFKSHWPGAPKSQFGGKAETTSADASFKHQEEVLARSIAHAKRFNTDVVRCFDFYRQEDVKPFRTEINNKLRDAAEVCTKAGIRLALENDFECNTATGREGAQVLASVMSPHFGLNWDPGNAVKTGEMDAFPGGWEALPKHRIFHCHVKNAVKGADGSVGWSPVDKGYVDWTRQFLALKNAHYHGAVSLETHWHGAATPEESTRISWAGMKKTLQASKTL